ncbi:MAG TPA: MFS transporter, partial [Steroidobacteraceae bacterium]
MSRILSRHNALTLYIPSLTLALGQGIAVPALPTYARSFGVTFAVASTVLVAFAVGSLLAGLPTGYLVDRIGRRRVIIAGPVLIAIASFLVAVAQSFPELLVYRFLAGVGQQMWNISRVTIVAETAADAQRGRQMSIMTALMSVGTILGPAVGGVIAAVWDVRIPFIFYGVLALISTLPGALLIRDPVAPPGEEPDTSRGTRRNANGWTWLRAQPIILFFVALFFAGMSRGALFSGSLNFYAVYAYGVGAETIGFLAGVASAIGIPITLVSGTVMDRFGRKAAIIPGFSLIAGSLGLMMVMALRGGPFTVFVVLFLAVQAALTITSGALQVLGSDLAPPDARGRFFGVWQTVNQAGTVLSPSVFALLSATAGAPAGFAYLGLAAAVVVVLIAGFVPD